VIAGVAAGAGALSMFAFANLATAELKPNEIAQSLDEGEGATVDLGQLASTTLGSGAAAESGAAGTAPVPPAPVTTIAGAPPVPSTAVDPAVTTTVAPPPVGRKVAIGDSVMLGAAEELTAAGYEVDASQNRQMSSYLPTIEGLRDTGQLGDVGVVVVHLGTNGNFSADTATRFFSALAGVPRVVVMTVSADRSWTVPNNDKLYGLPDQFPNVQILDWGRLADSCPGDCYYGDDIHLKPAGQQYYTALVQQQAG